MGLDTVELVIAFENKFNIQISDKDAANLLTPADVTDYIMGHKAFKTRMTREDVLTCILIITSEQLGIPHNKIAENSHFVTDLGAN